MLEAGRGMERAQPRRRRGFRMVCALFTVSVMAIDGSWLYRIAVSDACPPHGCLGLVSPWIRLCDWLVRGRPEPLSDLLMRYEWRGLIILLGTAILLSTILFFTLRRADAFQWQFRTRTVMLVVALVAVEGASIRELWRRVDAWECAQLESGSMIEYGCCLDTWVWGQDE